MKHVPLRQCLLALFFSLTAVTVRAQEPGPAAPDSGRVRLAHTYAALLNDARLTTGRLLDAALPLADPTSFDGKITAPPTDAQKWRTAYATLLMAGGPNQPQPLIPLGEVQRRLDAQPHRLFDSTGQATDLLDLIIAVVPYQRVRPDAFDEKLLTLTQPDSQLVAVAGAASPFTLAETVLAAPSREAAYGPDVLFRYDPSLFLLAEEGGNYGQLTVDFGDGTGYQAIAPGSLTSVTYDKTANVTLRFRLKAPDGTIRYASSPLAVVVAPGTPVARPTSATGYDADRVGATTVPFTFRAVTRIFRATRISPTPTQRMVPSPIPA